MIHALLVLAGDLAELGAVFVAFVALWRTVRVEWFWPASLEVHGRYAIRTCWWFVYASALHGAANIATHLAGAH